MGGFIMVHQVVGFRTEMVGSEPYLNNMQDPKRQLQPDWVRFFLPWGGIVSQLTKEQLLKGQIPSLSFQVPFKVPFDSLGRNMAESTRHRRRQAHP